MRDNQNIDVEIGAGISVTSWHDSDFEICIEGATECGGDVTLYLSLNRAAVLLDALTKHMARFHAPVLEEQ